MSLIFSTVACNATLARHICYVNYISPFPRNVSLGRLWLYKIKKWGDYFYTKHDLLAKGFSLPTLIYQWCFLYQHIRWFVSELIQYVLATTGNMSAVTAYNCLYNCMKIPWFERNVMRTWRVISIIAENKLHAHHKTHLHTMKVYITHGQRFAN